MEEATDLVKQFRNITVRSIHRWLERGCMNTPPDKKQALYYQPSLFILFPLFLMYLRISELASSDRWTPNMNNFRKDNDNNWWFTVAGKENKEREIAVGCKSLIQNSIVLWNYLFLSQDHEYTAL